MAWENFHQKPALRPENQEAREKERGPKASDRVHADVPSFLAGADPERVAAMRKGFFGDGYAR